MAVDMAEASRTPTGLWHRGSSRDLFAGAICGVLTAAYCLSYAALIFAGPLKQWPIEDIVKDKLMRFAQAYMMMANAGYRPAAPGDGFGGIYLTNDQMKDRERLYTEAVQYALAFAREEDGDAFLIGCSNYDTNRAFLLCIEAARLLAGGGNDRCAVKLLKLAIEEIEQEVKE